MLWFLQSYVFLVNFENYLVPGHLAAATSNWESATAECHQCHGYNTFGGLEIEIELHPRKQNMSLKKGTISTGNDYIFQPLIFKGDVSSLGWWKRFLWNVKAACWKTEKPMVGRLNGKLKRVHFWILCDLVLLCVCSSKYDFRLELKKICQSTSIYQHDSCSSCVMCTGVCWLAILIPISFKQMAFFCHCLLFPQSPWQGVFLAALLSLLMIIFSWCIRAKCRSLFLTSSLCFHSFLRNIRTLTKTGNVSGYWDIMCLKYVFGESFGHPFAGDYWGYGTVISSFVSESSAWPLSLDFL